MATIDYKQLSTPEANLIELLSAQNQDGTYSAKLMGSEPFSVLAAKTIYNTYNDIESNMAADVEGPASSTDNALARFDGTTGKLIQNSNAILTDAGALSLASNLTVSGTSALNGTVNTNGARAVNVTPTMTPLSGNLYGLYVQPTINSGASAGGTVSGLTVAATNSGTSNVTNIAGIEFIGGNGAASGSMQDLKAFRSSPINLSTGQIVNLYQFYATNAYNPSGTINTQYGLYVDALTSATTNYAIYTAGTAPSRLGGNLTVSGSIVNQNGVIQSTLAAGALISSLSTNNNAVHGFQISGSGTGSRDWRLEQGRAGANSFSISNATGGLTTPLIVNGATNNILIGCSSTSSDSGNGKLQLATHTTSAGGIGFGTDTSLYRDGTGYVSLYGPNADTTFRLWGGATQLFRITNSSTISYVQNLTGSLQLASNGITALTLDSTQRALFAGDVILNKIGSDPMLYSGGGRGLMIGTNAGAVALTITNTQVATFTAGVDVGAASYLAFTNRSAIRSSADGLIRLTNWSDTDFTRLQFGGTTASFPALKRVNAVLTCVLADDSAFTTIRALDFSAQGAATTTGANQVSYGGTTATTATAGAQTLPANPAGFIIVNIAGTTAKIPYYNS